MKIKDYYSILGVPSDADSPMIYDSYQKRIAELGEDSRKSSSPNYLSRVDVEEAYRILGASYINKEAYDKEYQQSIAQGILDFEMGEWLEEHVKREHDFVINRVLIPDAPQTVEVSTGKEWGMKALGCIGKAFLLLLFLIMIANVKRCSRQAVRDSYGTSYDTEVPTRSDADRKLQQAARDMNRTLPRKINDDITQYPVELTSSALIYVYGVKESTFIANRDRVASKKDQIANIKAMYSDMKPMIDLLLQTERGISYKYVSSESHTTELVAVTYSELAAI